MSELAEATNALIERATKGDYSTMRRALVVNDSPFLISLGGVVITGVPRSPKYNPRVNDVVLVLMDGPSPYVLQSVVRRDELDFQDANPSSPLSGVAFNAAIHRAIAWQGTIVFSSGGPFWGFTLPVIPAGFTGAWAINGDSAANALTVDGMQSYTSTQFFAKTNASTVSPIRFNFGCTYWVVR